MSSVHLNDLAAQKPTHARTLGALVCIEYLEKNGEKDICVKTLHHKMAI